VELGGDSQPRSADQKAGWFFGMSGEGTIGLHIAKDGKWIECNSKSRLPLLQWSHVAGSYDPASGLKVYINGKLENEVRTTGAITPASDVELWLGRSHTKTYPIRTEREFSKTFLSPMVFDGLIDEVKIYRRAMGDNEVAEAFATVQPKVAQPLQVSRSYRRALKARPRNSARCIRGSGTHRSGNSTGAWASIATFWCASMNRPVGSFSGAA
jgi:hypothetical protein